MGRSMRLLLEYHRGLFWDQYLWNIFCNKILETERGISLIAYADDLAIVTRAKYKTELEDKTQHFRKLIMWKLAEMGILVTIKKLNWYYYLVEDRYKHVDYVTKINYILFKSLCDLLNATQIKIIRSDWGFSSKLPNDSYTKGLFGDIAFKRADISGTISFTPAYRLKYLKYIFAPLKNVAIKFIFRAPPLAYYSNLFTMPFNKVVWITIAGYVVLCGFIIKIIFSWEVKEEDFVAISRNNDENKPSTMDIVMMQMAIICQMDFYHEPKSLSGKMATFTLLICTTFLYTAFSARIVLLLQSNTNSIKTLETLYNAKLDFGVEDQSFNRHFFLEPSDRADEYWRNLIYETKIKSSKGDNFFPVSKGMQLVRDSYFAFNVEMNAANNVILNTFTNNQICTLRTVDTIYKTDNPHIFCHKRSPYMEMFIVGLRRLCENGIHDREHRNCITKQPICLGRGNIFVSVGLKEAYFSFMVFGIGLCLSLLIFIIELISAHHLRKNNNVIAF
ncbi:uncharacterized protein LOC115889246 [Sitophilus oryzae]|uniref:Uncharacterized protein LOC115889246 n=1 Tax=Sitophilus oryzae TaxID=7048 RepID=A0A6J2YP29_SITOR|nr:uncharacterized protein LOC115889246 [Sitophilus oryzae]